VTTSHSRNRISALVAVSVGLFGAGIATAADAPKTDAACRQEVQRVAVWPNGPKAAQVPRYENREVTVCNGKVVSQKPLQNAAKTEPG